MQLGVKVNSDLFKLVKGFHHRWNQLKQCVDQRRVAIQRAQIQYDPANLSTTGGCGQGHVILILHVAIALFAFSTWIVLYLIHIIITTRAASWLEESKH